MEQVGPSLSPKADLYTRKTRDWAQGGNRNAYQDPGFFRHYVPRNDERGSAPK